MNGEEVSFFSTVVKNGPFHMGRSSKWIISGRSKVGRSVCPAASAAIMTTAPNSRIDTSTDSLPERPQRRIV
jgi:hypothetical protein